MKRPSLGALIFTRDEGVVVDLGVGVGVSVGIPKVDLLFCKGGVIKAYQLLTGITSLPLPM